MVKAVLKNLSENKLQLFGFLKNTKVKNKLLILESFFCCAIILSVMTGLYTINKVKIGSKLYNNISINNELLGGVSGLKSDLNEVRATLLTLMGATDREKMDKLKGKIEALSNGINLSFEKILKNIKESKIKTALLEAETQWKDFRNTRDTELIPAIYNKDIPKAKELALGIQKQRYEKFVQETGAARDLLKISITKYELSATKAANRNIKIILAVNAFLLILSISLALVIVNFIVTPLSQTTKVAIEMAQGNMMQKDLEIDQQDELGELAQAFNSMIGHLRHLATVAEKTAKGDLSSNAEVRSDNDMLGIAFSNVISTQIKLAETATRIADGDLEADVPIRSAQDQLGNAFAQMAHNLKSLVTQINTVSHDLTNLSTSLAKTTQQATQASTHLAEGTGQITQATANVAKNSQAAAQSSQSANDHANKGQETAKRLQDKMKTIQSTVLKTQEAIEGLGHQSQKIGDIVNVITKIAEQTNLLSLNAAIEAARAGESGRGFAVVADEIRKLAEHSATSASEISKLIGNVQEETAKAVNVTEEGTREVQEGGLMMVDTAKAFEAIVSTVEHVSIQIEQIAATAEETAATTEETAAASEEQAGAMQEIAVNAETLAGTANVLRQLVARFKVTAN